MLFKINDTVLESMMKQMNFSDYLDMDNVNINDLLFKLGLFDNKKVSTPVSTILRERYSVTDMTLKELYELTNIKLTAKVCNHTKSCVEYISYENEPELSIILLLQMTTAIPLFFKPIKYNKCLYIDGGVAGGYAIEIAGKNYLGINLKGPNRKDKQNTLIDELPIIDYFIKGLCIACQDSSKIDKRNIYIPSNIHFTNFEVSMEEKKQLIDDGYKLTLQHIDEYKLVNDLYLEDQ